MFLLSITQNARVALSIPTMNMEQLVHGYRSIWYHIFLLNHQSYPVIIMPINKYFLTKKPHFENIFQKAIGARGKQN